MHTLRDIELWTSNSVLVLCDSNEDVDKAFEAYSNVLTNIEWKEERNIRLVTRSVSNDPEGPPHIIIGNFGLIYELMFQGNLDIGHTKHLIIIGCDTLCELFKKTKLFHINSMIQLANLIQNFNMVLFFFLSLK